MPADALDATWILDSADDAIVCHDRHGRVTLWNRAAQRLLGYASHDVLGRDISLIFAPEGQHEIAAALVCIDHGEAAPPSDRVLLTRSLQRITVWVATSPIRDPDGQVVGASHVCRPIDPTHSAAAALHLAALVQSSDDVIVSKDLNGIVQSWNPAAERLFGYRAEEMIGRSITTIVPLDRMEEEDYVLGRIRSGLSVEHFETVRQAKNGARIDISLTVSPIRDHTGRVIGASKIARDIRERKRLVYERQLAAVNEEAARREVLEVQNRRIQEAARLKSEFVANMSHELRTPLNSIVGFAELMADARFGPLPGRYQQFAQVMHSSAQHLLQLINDILDLAKVESGKIDLRAEPVEIQKVIDEVTAIIRGLAAKRKVRVTAEVDPAIGIVQLDPLRLKQVLYNYLSNAVKFTPPGGAVSARVRPLEGERLQIEVEDTGIGIKAEDQHRLFVEFQQLDAGPAKKFEGSGLGLALTKRLVEAQGGTVGVRSEFGAGSTFWATLPRRVTAEGAEITGSTRVASHEIHTDHR